MIYNKFKSIALTLVLVGLSLSSCKDYLDINVDPNQSTISRIDLQLSSAQMYTAIGMGQRIYPIVSIWSQYYTGGPGVSLGDPDQHKLSSSEGNEVFRSLYRSSLNLNYIINNSTENYYIAVAKIMQAYNFQVCADIFGDVPFSEALKGDIADGSIFDPKYESAERVVYPGVETLLNDAIALIDGGGAYQLPGNDDLIYGGDMVKWKKFAKTMLLKLYIREGKSSLPAGFYTADEDFITANDDMAKMSFFGGSTASNPFWNAAKSTALGNFYIATTTVLDYLNNTNDPRIDKFFDPASTGHRGINPGDIQAYPTGDNDFSRPAGAKAAGGGLIFSPTAPVIFMSAWEGNLLLAEANLKYSVSDLNAAYAAGVEANFEYLGLGYPQDSIYLANGGKIDAGNPIKSIALQKWTCMNGLQPVEGWIETRRYDSSSSPIFTSAGGIFKSPTHNALGAGIFPSILPYPENEESLNKSFPGQHQLTDKVFWDK